MSLNSKELKVIVDLGNSLGYVGDELKQFVNDERMRIEKGNAAKRVFELEKSKLQNAKEMEEQKNKAEEKRLEIAERAKAEAEEKRLAKEAEQKRLEIEAEMADRERRTKLELEARAAQDKKEQREFELKKLASQASQNARNTQPDMLTLKSIFLNLSQLRTLSVQQNTSKHLLRMLADINETLLSDTIQVLEAFDKATNCLSADKKPTIGFVVPVRSQLKAHLHSSGEDSEIIQQLKENLMLKLDRYFTITDLHCVAALLDPRLKSNNNLMSADQRDRAMKLLKQMVSEVPQDHVQSVSSSTNRTDTDSLSPLRKKRRVAEDDFFGDMFTATTSQEDSEVGHSIYDEK